MTWSPGLSCSEWWNQAKATIRIETKFLRLLQPVTIGDRIDGWRVCWLGGWDRGRLFYIVTYWAAMAAAIATQAVRPDVRS